MKPLLDRLRELVAEDEGGADASWMPLRAAEAKELLARLDALELAVAGITVGEWRTVHPGRSKP